MTLGLDAKKPNVYRCTMRKQSTGASPNSTATGRHSAAVVDRSSRAAPDNCAIT